LVGVGGMDLYRAEAPGPTTDKLTARISETAKVLWILYLVFTSIAVMTYYFLGMSVFDAINHALTTMASGGFSTKNSSFASFANPSLEYACSIFMFLSGINFVLHYRLFLRRDVSILKDPELRFYITMVFIAVLLITICVWVTGGVSFANSFRQALFQITSLASSTGYASADYNLWPYFAQFVIILIMVIGGSAGSTSGGLKCIRAMMLVKQGVRELHQMLHPKGIIPLRLGQSIVNSSTASAIFAHFFLYLLILVVVTLFVTASGLDLVSAVSSVIAALSNMGPALGEAGPMSNYYSFPEHIKLMLAATMIIGRLELFTILVLLTRDFWES